MKKTGRIKLAREIIARIKKRDAGAPIDGVCSEGMHGTLILFTGDPHREV